MISKSYLWILRIITFLSLAFLVFIILRIDPEAGSFSKIYFYSALFLFLAGVFNLFLLRLRKKNMHGELVYENTVLSFRQGILLAILAIILLVLQGLRMLIWWDGLLVVAGIFLIEFYFLSREES